jgi:hypothetical protein
MLAVRAMRRVVLDEPAHTALVEQALDALGEELRNVETLLRRAYRAYGALDEDARQNLVGLNRRLRALLVKLVTSLDG